MTPGRFIALEGGEGMGKSTQARLLVDALEAQGITVALTREPGGTAGAEAIRELLLSPPGDGWTRESEALLFAAARADHVARLIQPAIASGSWVVCDRFVDSSLAYQGVAGGLGIEKVRALHAIGSHGLLPDLTILIEAGSELVDDRLEKRDGGVTDAIGRRGAEYHSAVNAVFRSLAEAEPERFARVDGAGSIETVHARVLSSIRPLLERC